MWPVRVRRLSAYTTPAVMSALRVHLKEVQIHHYYADSIWPVRISFSYFLSFLSVLFLSRGVQRLMPAGPSVKVLTGGHLLQRIETNRLLPLFFVFLSLVFFLLSFALPYPFIQPGSRLLESRGAWSVVCPLVSCLGYRRRQYE